MPLFALICFDKPNALDLRMATREAHLAYVRENLAMVKVAGPMLDAGDGMAGSLFVIEAETRDAVEAFNAADPYQQAGLFGQVEIRGFRATLGQL
ncbi:YciI family protein [Phenylobacterium sp.]|uniref:YciI family protein n=1 Tax=Phenylobacterium sp. TaxID=1871053 RepID=UPI0035660784